MSSSWNTGPGGGPAAPPPPPRGRNTAVIVAAAAVAAAILAAVVVFAVTRSQHSATPAAGSASPSPTVTVTAGSPAASAAIIQAPPRTIFIPPPSQSGDVGTPDSYVTDIWNAGVTAPAAWIDSTGRQLCTAWEAGDTTAYTDQLLLAGGIYSWHLGTFNSITATDLCPNTPGGP